MTVNAKKRGMVRKGSIAKTKHHVLVIDDEEVNRMLAKAVLQSLNIDTVLASGGHEALKIMKRQKFDIILTDLNMPGMDGWETTKKIRNDYGDQVIIIGLSAGNINQLKQKCLHGGMNDVLQKPLDVKQFMAYLDNIRQTAAGINKNVPVPHQIDGKTDARNISNATDHEPIYYSLDKLSSLLLGNQNELAKMVKLFIEIAPQLASQLYEASKKKDFTLLKQTAHKLKPSVDFMDIGCLKLPLKTLEQYNGASENEPAIIAMAAEVKRVIDITASHLAEKYGK